jgi:acyl transferase domain-containing protein
VSSVVGTVAGPSLMSTPEYWTRQIHCPVRPADSIRALRETKPSVLLEIGLHPVPNGAPPAIAPEADFLWASSLNRDREHSESLLEAVSALYVHGVNFNWGSLLASSAGKRVPLPTYPFQRDRFWLQEGIADVQRTLDEDLRSEIKFAQQESTSGETPALAQNNPASAESDFTRNLQSATPTRRRDLLIAHLRSLVATVLGFDPSREIDLEHGLFELGMDSIMSVEFSGRLGRILGLQLPATLTFIYPNIKALTDYILFEALKFDSETEDTVNNPLIDPVNDLSGSQSVDDLSEDELANLLLKKLEQLK